MGKPGPKRERLALKNSSLSLDEFSHLFRQELDKHENPEMAYRAVVDPDHRKRFAQFFTPEPIADLMLDWIADIHPQTILDPAVGTGIFPRLVKKRQPSTCMTLLDSDPLAMQACRQVLSESAHFSYLVQDFLVWNDQTTFDAVVANPPYLRHHDMLYPYDIFHFVGKKNQVRLSRLSNIYVLFILEICRRLRVGGRASIIVPSEWVNANFGDPLKDFLLTRSLLRTLIYFSHASVYFEDALTTACILLIEKLSSADRRSEVHTLYVPDNVPLPTLRAVATSKTEDGGHVLRHQRFSRERLLKAKKWNDLLINGSRRRVQGLIPLAKLATTRRGIATGSNAFFHLSPSTATHRKIRAQNLKFCIGKSLDVRGSIFAQNDLARLIEDDRRICLLDMETEPDENESAYIEEGLRRQLNKRYLCAARPNAWYRMEKRTPAPIWASVFGRDRFRFVLNEARIANLTTFHGIYPNSSDPTFCAAFTACLNSPFLQTLARENLRVYGGGLLKMEPGDLLDFEIPDLRCVSPSILQALAGLLRKLDASERQNLDPRDTYISLDHAVLAAAEQATRQITLLE